MTLTATADHTAELADLATIADIIRDVRAFIVETFLLGCGSGFDDGASLLDSQVVDSTGVMHVVAFIEERYGLTVGDDDLSADNLDSVERIARFVARRHREAPV